MPVCMGSQNGERTIHCLQLLFSLIENEREKENQSCVAASFAVTRSRERHSQMATIDDRDERLAERDEVSYPTAHLIDTEPFYKNFASIHNDLQHRDDGQSICRVCRELHSRG